MKVIVKGIEARDRLIRGADFLADCVKPTLGAYGLNGVTEKSLRITNDGITIAREIELKDEIENLGVRILRESSVKTNDEVGDGTTSAIVLAQAILKESLKHLPTGKTFGGKTPSELMHTIEKERVEIIEKLKEKSTPITTREELIESALVSVQDVELADIIGSTQFELGPDGVILAEETTERVTTVEKVRGIRIDNGLGTSLVMNNMEKQCLEAEDAAVLLTNHTVEALTPLLPLMEQLYGKMGIKTLVIVARGFTTQAVKDCMANTEKGFSIFPINAPYVDQNEVMKDLAAILGGHYINSEQKDLDAIQATDIGHIERLVAHRYDAIFTGRDDEDSKERVEKRLVELKDQLEGSMSEFEKKNLALRIAQLTTGFAILKVGATTEVERRYKKDKADDAVNAVRAAYQEGTVAGAGIAFKEIADSLPDSYILKTPLMSIYEQIKSTSPADYEIPTWVRDPVKVLRIALSNACSVAGTFSTACVAIATERIKPKYVQEVEGE